jgi:hypothetical protein
LPLDFHELVRIGPAGRREGCRRFGAGLLLLCIASMTVLLVAVTTSAKEPATVVTIEVMERRG